MRGQRANKTTNCKIHLVNDKVDNNIGRIEYNPIFTGANTVQSKIKENREGRD